MNINKNIKLIVSDMDGTILGNNKQLPSENIKAVKMLQEYNIPVVLCTGRPHFMVQEYMRQLNLSTQIISSNGALIYDISTDSPVFSSNLDLTSLKNICEFATDNEIDFLLYDETTVYYTQRSKRIEIFHAYNEIAAKGGSKKVPCVLLEEQYNDIISGKRNISKILVTELKKGDLTKTNEFLKTIPSIYAVPSMDIVIDIMNANVSKGNAVKKLSKHLSIPLENILVIGDHKNDVSMLSVAGFSASMANGHQEAKNSAQFITTKTNDDAGFAEAVHHFVFDEY